MSRDDTILLPQPSDVTWGDKTIQLGPDDRISLPVDEKEDLLPIVERFTSELREACRLDLEIVAGSRGERRDVVAFSRDSTLATEAYTIESDSDGLDINYGDPAGAFYATRTLKQLFEQFGRAIPRIEVTDAPDFEDRSVMFDVSRNKIPTLETLEGVVDLLADLKVNQFQLYIEGFPFAYPSFPQVWQDGTPLTGEDLIELDAYCRERFVELVPNQNSLGHMEDWLAREEFNHLAECPDGLERGDETNPPTTLDPTDPEVIEFLSETYDDLLPNFTSSRFNVGCDEPWELGKGKSERVCEERGTGQVYLEFLEAVKRLVEGRDNTMMFWGDIVNKHPEIVPEVPSDVTVLEWGYTADHPFHERAANYEDVEIPFYVCPGTSTWNSIAGQTSKMKANLKNAAVNGKEHGAKGYLLTDWGDNGHWQPLPVSYPGYAYGAALAWSVAENEDVDVARYLDRFVFEDENETMGQLVMDLGDYSLREDEALPNRTISFEVLLNGFDEDDHVPDTVTMEGFQGVVEYVSKLEDRLATVEMACDDAELLEREIRNAVRMVRQGARLGQLRLLERGDDEFESALEQNAAELDVILGEFRSTWLARNRYSSLDDSIAPLRELRSAYEAVERRT
ncbi:beta-N-acetylhexosaminidase [Halomontanus rarus]|uniref:beta-N-acetylhexosaminidase n=1 Tax=Halomontanus rarus TaxID=3034020 RepID=UPI0023E7E51E|nr:family 20 glycosylhydrolase [Halovivax sp. TS33]